ncbi:unnamed protein product [Prorocentrum cordatum]|uniref:Uncharacterized protein n=1 Tax=Prorocentrum cordatum TaxID=2364126 RepID=A0ABN9R6B1_9DINO|nr:unnamed protein product [Polarella glacialis]
MGPVWWWGHIWTATGAMAPAPRTCSTGPPGRSCSSSRRRTGPPGTFSAPRWPVSSDGARVVVAADADEDLGADAGSVYVFDGATGSQLLKLLAADGAAVDRFGKSLAVSSDGARVVVGAYADDDLGLSSGSVYVFDTSVPSTTIIESITSVPSTTTGTATTESFTTASSTTTTVSTTSVPSTTTGATTAESFTTASSTTTTVSTTSVPSTTTGATTAESFTTASSTTAGLRATPAPNCASLQWFDESRGQCEACPEGMQPSSDRTDCEDETVLGMTELQLAMVATVGGLAATIFAAVSAWQASRCLRARETRHAQEAVAT